MLTIGIPSYNNNQILEELLYHLKNIIPSNTKILIIDDGSETEIPNSFLNIYKDIKIIKHEVNKGLAAARNTIINNTDTELLLQLDCDCFPEKGMLEDHIQWNLNNPNLIGAANKVDWHPSIIKTNFHLFMGGVLSPTWTSENFHSTPFNFYAGVLSLKIKKIQELNIFYDENFKTYGCEETEWSYRLFNENIKFSFLNNFKCFHKSNITFEKYLNNVQKKAKNVIYFYQKHPNDLYLKRWVAKGFGYLDNIKLYDNLYEKYEKLFLETLNKSYLDPLLSKIQPYIYSYNLAKGLIKEKNYMNLKNSELEEIGKNNFKNLIKIL